MRLISVCALVLTLWVGVDVPTAQACAGGPFITQAMQGVEYILNEYPILVAGRIIGVSDSGYNGVLQIDHYLRGDPGNEFVVYQQHPAETALLLAQGRPVPWNCAGAGRLLQAGTHFIGGFTIGETGVFSGRVFPAGYDGRFTIGQAGDADTPLSTDYPGMLAYLTQRATLTPAPPAHSWMPEFVSVRVTDETGQEFNLASGSRTFAPAPPPALDLPCGKYWSPFCVDAPDGHDQAYFYRSGSDAGWEGLDGFLNGSHSYLMAFRGHTGVFSPASDAIVVWEPKAENALGVYSTAGQFQFFNSVFTKRDLINRTALTLPDELLIPGSGAWSPDGHTFAFSTRGGVWLWDVLLAGAQPRLLVRTHDRPIQVRGFSPAGRFLALESGIRRWHLELSGGRALPDGVFSPDDRQLAVFDTQADGVRPMSLFRIFPRFELIGGPLPFPPIQITALEWMDDGTAIYHYCINEDSYADGILSPDRTGCLIYSPRLPRYLGEAGFQMPGVAYDYEPLTESIGIVVDHDTVWLNGALIDLTVPGAGALVSIQLTPLIDLDRSHFATSSWYPESGGS